MPHRLLRFATVRRAVAIWERSTVARAVQRWTASRAGQFLGHLWQAMDEHETIDMAAMVAFWSMLSIFPFVMLLLSIIGLLKLPILGIELMNLLRQALPGTSARLFERSIREVVDTRHGWLAGGALVMGLWTASSGTSGVMTALNRAWGAIEKRPFVRRKMIALAVTAIGGLLLLIMIAALVLAPQLIDALFLIRIEISPSWQRLWLLLRWPIVGVTMLTVLAIIYSVLPALSWRRLRVLPGSIAALLLWLVASRGLAAYIHWFNAYAHFYGRLAVMIVLLTWMYLSALAILIGGELNAILSRPLDKDSPRR